jgi:hypothetical protein
VTLRRVVATRYVEALREGGSLPGLMEADDDGLYVTKFRGAGQGAAALVSEVLAGELARALGLPVPELVVIEVAPEVGHAEPDPEIQELLEASPGANLGMDFLPGALMFALPAEPSIDPAFAADVVWFDALVTNIDRTHRNPNLLAWHGRTWLIDHGAALYVHHTWKDPEEHARRPFERSREHVLLPFASSVAAASERLADRVTPRVLEDLVAAIPDDWLPVDALVGGADAQRRAYVAYLTARLAARDAWTQEADRARAA